MESKDCFKKTKWWGRHGPNTRPASLPKLYLNWKVRTSSSHQAGYLGTQPGNGSGQGKVT